MTKAERQKQEAEIMMQLEADRKTFARVSEIDEAMNEVKRCSRLCGKTKDGLDYLWYGNIISAMRKALDLYDNKADTPQTETQTETQNSNDDFPSSLEDWEDEYTEHDRVDCSWK